MNYRIVADSSADLMTLEDVSFVSVPMRIVAGNREFVDDRALDTKEMLDMLADYKGESRSACPGVGEYLEAFGDAENIFCVTITSGLSGSFNAASAAARQYCAAHPDRRVHVIDSLSASAECALIVERLRALVLKQLPFDEIVDKITAYCKHTHLSFCLESLHNLANNGRVSHVTAKVAGLFGIRIVGQASLKGELETVSKARGAEKAITEILKNMQENGYRGGNVRIHHCEQVRAALIIRKRLLALYPEANIRIAETHALCSFYAERGGFLIGYEGKRKPEKIN